MSNLNVNSGEIKGNTTSKEGQLNNDSCNTYYASSNSLLEKEKSTMKKNQTVVETTNSIEETTFAKQENHVARFVESDYIPNAIKAIIFTPKDYSDKYVKADLFHAISAVNAIRDFVAGNVERVGEAVHIRNQAFSKYDGIGSLYVGNNIAKQALAEGHSEFSIAVNGHPVSIRLPSINNEKAVDLIGEWVRVKMITDFSGSVVPAEDLNHMNNLTMKHFFLEKLFCGAKIVAFTEPTVVKGEVWNWANQAAKQLKSDILAEDGSFKNHDEIMADVYERYNQHQDNFKLARETKRVQTIAPIAGLDVVTMIRVNDIEMKVDDVPQGEYSSYDRAGFRRNYKIRISNNMDSRDALVTLATKGFSLKTFVG